MRFCEHVVFQFPAQLRQRSALAELVESYTVCGAYAKGCGRGIPQNMKS